MAQSFLNGRVTLHPGDCRKVVPTLAENSIDACVTDPPYSLVSIVKRFGKEGSALAKSNGASGVYRRASAGFMGKAWDTGEVSFNPEFWSDVVRVLKPGAHLVAFGGTRSFHRLVCAIEDGGFEVRDQIGWAFGSGFPKSHNLPGGLGTALKPAWEPICLARKPLDGTVAENVRKWGTGALNIDGTRIPTGDGLSGGAYSSGDKRRSDASSYYTGTSAGEFRQPPGRWPANLCHDGSDEVLAAFPESKGQQATVTGREPSAKTRNVLGLYNKRATAEPRNDSGSAARFFYTSKADTDDRLGSKHPTVKPVDLIQWLCRLVTPPKGVILDPFAGTGTTGEAAWREGFSAVLIEREAEYQADIARRMELCLAGPDARRHATIKAKGQVEDAGPLFAGDAA